MLDVLLVLGLGVIVGLSVAPKSLVMPSRLEMLLLAIVLVLLAMFLVFIWREAPHDEREARNQAVASRVAYLVGAGVLLVGLVVQSLQHQLDAVIPIALLAMIATKLVLQRIQDDC
ncbi:hypothetical protein CR970_01250 [Candidatus Saccharibacteria bacterium]|nr:MAG: hypothetical protein CR970_01250 [Candidatus Saccharibacteria bacterium]